MVGADIIGMVVGVVVGRQERLKRQRIVRKANYLTKKRNPKSGIEFIQAANHEARRNWIENRESLFFPAENAEEYLDNRECILRMI